MKEKNIPQDTAIQRDSIRDVLMDMGYRMVRKLGKGEKNVQVCP